MYVASVAWPRWSSGCLGCRVPATTPLARNADPGCLLVVGVGVVHAGRAHLVELPAVAGDGSGRSTTSRTSGPPKRVIYGSRARHAGYGVRKGSARAHTTCGRIGVRAITRAERAFER